MKKWLTYVSLAVILFACVFAGINMGQMERTYDGTKAPVSVYDLQQNPDSYDDSAVNGAADAIVQQNLANSHSVNDVTSIVFDFRGYDTMGEAFILLTSVAGVTVLLGRKNRKEEEKDEKN